MSSILTSSQAAPVNAGPFNADPAAPGRLTGMGQITAAHQTGSDGGFATYRLVIEDGLSILRHSRTSRVAMDVNVLDLTDRILQAHLASNRVLKASFSVDNRCVGKYPVRPFWMQYDVTDFDYLRMIWFREGISYVILASGGSSEDHPQHSLILFDDGRDLDVNGSARVRFHRADGTESHDGITEWNARRSLQSGSIARSVWDHTSASVSNATEENHADQRGIRGVVSVDAGRLSSRGFVGG